MVDINKKALNFLVNQRWKEAQKLFFYNAKINPTHETYNNLGFYLISEGFECENGKIRNSNKLGLKYLLKAYELKKTSINLCAIAQAYNYQLRRATENEKKIIYRQMLDCFKRSLELEYLDEVYYNYLLMCHLISPCDVEVLAQIPKLLHKFPSVESAILALSVFNINDRFDEGIKILNEYQTRLDPYENLLYCTKFRLYEEGYRFCEEVFEHFNVDDVIFSCIIDCCVNTSRLEKAQYYLQCMRERKDLKRNSKIGLKKYYIDNQSNHREKIINDCIFTHPIILSCCYFDCPIHNNRLDICKEESGNRNQLFE